MTTRRYILEDGNIHNYRCDKLKPYLMLTAGGIWSGMMLMKPGKRLT
jgi:hypothetical protein